MAYGLYVPRDSLRVTTKQGSVLCNLIPTVYFDDSIVPVLLEPSDRKFQNLRTIIVIADIHQGLHKSADDLAIIYPPCLTFWHWSGVTPYTSSCEFAGSCVFGKQLPEIL